MHTWREGIFSKAYSLYERGKVAESFEWFLKGASAGDASCMIWVGVLYGDGVKQDIRNQREIGWYKRAWRSGDLSAATNIAIVYRNQKHYANAEIWFRKAINSGDGDANLELAKMLAMLGRSEEEICSYLEETIASKHVTGDSVEEAEQLLKERQK